MRYLVFSVLLLTACTDGGPTAPAVAVPPPAPPPLEVHGQVTAFAVQQVGNPTMRAVVYTVELTANRTARCWTTVRWLDRTGNLLGMDYLPAGTVIPPGTSAHSSSDWHPREIANAIADSRVFADCEEVE